MKGRSQGVQTIGRDSSRRREWPPVILRFQQQAERVLFGPVLKHVHNKRNVASLQFWMAIRPDIDGHPNFLTLDLLERLDSQAVPSPTTPTVHLTALHRQKHVVCPCISFDNFELGLDQTVQDVRYDCE